LIKNADKTKNICFPVGTILAVNHLYDVLDFSSVFSKHKKHGIDINELLKALVSYKLTDNFSIKKAHEWINREKFLISLTLRNSVK
jgi:transposase